MTRRLWPALLCVLWVALLLGPLALPDRVLAARDMAFLHLPLRTDFQRLLHDGLPRWDPWLHGGQPVLSNPHYAAWYPTTWLLLLVPPHVALQWALLLHAALAFAGAWRLARRWGCGPPARAFAALAFTGSGYFVSLPGLPLVFLGMAWWPWVVATGDAALRPGDDDSAAARTRSVLALACALGLQMLNCDPAAVLASLLALLALGVDAHRARARPWRRLAAGVALAVALAAVQIVPAAFRLRDSARGTGLAAEEAAVWSTRPLRLTEVVFPHLFGDAARDEEDLYFGWQLHDREYPFLLSIYPGLLVALLGAAALARGAIPRRGALALGVAAGLLLGLGRHEPLWPLLRQLLPFLTALRYPEKFLLLALACLTFAAALELDRLLETSPHRGSRPPLFWPLILASVTLAAALVTAAFFTLAPEAAANFVRSHSGLPPTPAALARGAAYLQREVLVTATACAGALAALLALGSRLSRRAVALLALGFLAADLLRHGAGLNPTMARLDFAAAAPLARELPAGARLYHESDVTPTAPVGLRVGPPGEQQLRARLARLEPLSATLWGLGHVLETDYDLTLSSWGRWALATIRSEWPQPELAARILDAWSIDARVVPRMPEEVLAELRAGVRHPASARLAFNSTALPRFRVVPAASFHADARTARSAAREEGYAVAAHEHLIGAPGERVDFSPGAVELRADRGAEITLRTASAGEALVVAAVTFDDGWSARAEGVELRTWPTALGELALAVPAGRREITLRYRDPWVRVGALLSSVAVLCALLALSRSRARVPRGIEPSLHSLVPSESEGPGGGVGH